VPQQRPAHSPEDAAGKGQPDARAETSLPEKPPLPDKKPPPEGESGEAPSQSESLPPARVSRPLDVEAERQCLVRLGELGADFEAGETISDPAGCLIPHPVKLSGLGEGIRLEPAATLNCAEAEAVVRFTRATIVPEATKAFGAGIKTVHQASGFVCRPRHGTDKISEHAYGNALDIASFELSNGKTVEVEPKPDSDAAGFLDAVRKAACGPFKTVLGPGSDPDHELHFHLDLQPRRNGGTFCQ
jgi:hypothetical protein